VESVWAANLTHILRPLFFEVPNSPVALPKIFVGRKWLFREILEHFSSDLPTSRGMVIHGSSTSGKTSIILQLVQNSYFGSKGFHIKFVCLKFIFTLSFRSKVKVELRNIPTKNKTHCCIHPLLSVLPLLTRGTLKFTC